MPETVCSISHIAERYNAYPGETMRLYTRIQANRQAELTLSVRLPRGIEFMAFQPPQGLSAQALQVLDDAAGTQLRYPFTASDQGEYEFTTEGVLLNPEQDTFLVSDASAAAPDGREMCFEAVRIALKVQGKYMNYLPELYRTDELMGRFLMLFESFWGPIEQQVRQVDWYFDPDLTPAKMLPWLSTWVGAFWDETLPEARQRQLLRNAVSHYQRRGTREALEEFLALYTGGRVSITEQPARNLVLGAGARMGQRVALGTGNAPHSFTVDVSVPADNFNIPAGMEPAVVDNLFRKKLETIINLHKPAHTVHTLKLEVIR